MLLLADYEGLNAGFALLFGLIIMAPAFLLGVGGVVAGSMAAATHARSLVGHIAFVLSVLAIGCTLSGYWEERNHVNPRGEHFLPPPYFYIASLATIGTAQLLCISDLNVDRAIRFRKGGAFLS